MLRSLSVGRALASMLLISSSTAALAAPPPPPPVEMPQAARADVPLGVRYLMESYKLSKADAVERLSFENDVIALAKEIKSSGEGAFGGVWIEHEPTYKIVVGFADNKDRSALRERIRPSMRRYVQIKNVKRSEQQIDEDSDQLTNLLNRSGIKFVSSYDFTNQKFVVEVETNDLAARTKELVPPALASDVMVRVRKLPGKSAAPSGLRAGDQIYGGYWYYAKPDATIEPDCSFSYNVTFNAARTPGILTAGHCNGGVQWGTGQYWDKKIDHWVQIGAPIIARWADGTKYDYQLHETSGYGQGPYVYFVNRQNRPGYAANGYFKVIGQIGYYDQKAGMVLCKSGWKTGLSCGTITNGAYTYNGAKGWILIQNAQEPQIADAGDSGGAVFRPPDAAGNIIASGSMTAADHGCIGTTCRGVEMPIDYIDDHMPIYLVIGTP